MDFAGGLQVTQEGAWIGREFLGETREVQAAAGIIARGLSQRTAMGKQVQIDPGLADRPGAAGGANTIDDRPAADQRDEGVPVGALWIELRLALQQGQQEVLAEVVLVGPAKGQPVGAGAGVAGGDAEGRGEMRGVPGGLAGTGWGVCRHVFWFPGRGGCDGGNGARGGEGSKPIKAINPRLEFQKPPESSETMGFQG